MFEGGRSLYDRVDSVIEGGSFVLDKNGSVCEGGSSVVDRRVSLLDRGIPMESPSKNKTSKHPATDSNHFLVLFRASRFDSVILLSGQSISKFCSFCCETCNG